MTGMLTPAVAGFLLCLSLCLDLGVVNLALIRTALLEGFWPALVLAVGSTVGDLCYALVSATVLTLLLDSRALRLTLWVGGSVALVGLCIEQLRGWWRPAPPPVDDRPRIPTPWRARFFQGAALALASPSAILWYAAAGGSIIASAAGDRARLLPFLGGFVTGGLSWSVTLAAVVSRARRRIGPRAQRLLHLVGALLLLYLAVMVGVRGWREFVR
jgi:L-lysine exporter family protein LysE/ArgO